LWKPRDELALSEQGGNVDAQTSATPPRKARRRAVVIPLVIAAILAGLAVFAYWLNHPPADLDGDTPRTRYDDLLLSCYTPGWQWALLAVVVAAYVACPILVVVGAVLEYRRRDWSGAAFLILAVSALAFALCTGSLVTDIISLSCL
jgi:hypothetical protein